MSLLFAPRRGAGVIDALMRCKKTLCPVYRFNRLTGFDGHEIELTYALMKNVKIAVDFYSVKGDVLNNNQEVLQADLSVKF